METVLLEKAKAGAQPAQSSPAIKLSSPQLLAGKPKKGKKTVAATPREQPKKQLAEKKNNQRSEGPAGKRRGRGALYNALNRRGRGRVKSASNGRPNWRRDSPDVEERDRWSPPRAHNSQSVVQPWIIPPQNLVQGNTNWSEDHFPEDQHFGNCGEENKQRFQNNSQRPRIEPWLNLFDVFPSNQSCQNNQGFGQRFTDEDRYSNSDQRFGRGFLNEDRYQNDGQRFGRRFPDEDRFSNDYARDGRFPDDSRQMNNNMMRRRQMLSKSRYMPY